MITPAFSITATERVLPRLAIDLTSAILDPRISFSRSLNTATRVNSSGLIEAVNVDTARFDFNPVNLICRGLLIEEQRQNLLRYSSAAQITRECTVSTVSGAFTDGETVTATGGGVGVYVQSQSSATVFALAATTGTFTGTLTGSVSGQTALITSTGPVNGLTNITVSANSIVSPDGSQNAGKIEENIVNGQHSILQTSGSFLDNTVYTLSVYLKAAERSWARVSVRTKTNALPGVYINLATGALGSSVSSPTSVGVQNAGNGWWRVTVSADVLSGAFNAGLTVWTSTANGSISHQGVLGSGFYVWGIQAEAGAFATSYIPTTTTALTRNADVATMTGANFSDWYSAGAGGVVARVLPSTVSGTCPALQFDDATANEVITLRGSTTNPELVIVAGGSPQAQIDAGTIAANTAYNLGAAWDTDNCAASVNGGAAVTDTTATIPTVTQARLGSDGTNYLNGHLETVRYWPQRIIDAEVQAFSK